MSPTKEDFLYVNPLPQFSSDQDRELFVPPAMFSVLLQKVTPDDV